MPNIPPPPPGFTLDGAAPSPSADIPPPPPGFTMDGPPAPAPASPDTPSRFSLPTSLDDALTRVKQGGLFLTPKQPGVQQDGSLRDDNGNVLGPDGNIDFDLSPPPLEGLVPAPPMASAAIASLAGKAVSNPILQKLGGMALDRAPMAAGAAVGHAIGGPVGGMVGMGIGESLKGAVASAGPAIGSAVQSGVSALGGAIPSISAAVDHYIRSQRDPDYAASLQKKEGK